MAASVSISSTSRYKDTDVFDQGGTVEFALQVPPAEFQTVPVGSTIHTVRNNEIGFLDMLAVRYYGPGSEKLWWVIAQANAMVDPEREMYAGQRLVVPPRSRLTQFLGRGGDGAG